MAETRKIKLSKRVSITLDIFWRHSSCSLYRIFYFIPQIRFNKLDIEYAVGWLPKYVIAFNWLYALADINIFINQTEKDHVLE